jgi:hypothetical protein
MKSKAEVNYSPGKCCCNCVFFIEDDEEGEYAEGPEEEEGEETGKCQLVAGEIEENMWCELFRGKRAMTLAEGGGY